MHFYGMNGLKLRLYNRGLLAILVACTGLLAHKAEAQYRLFNWGQNALGTLPITWIANNSSLYGRGLPGQIRAFSNTAKIAGGANHTLALKTDGTVWAWGNNTYGQLGIGTYARGSDKPVQVVGLTNVIAIAAGGNHSIALKSDGTVWAWGDNTSGELGNSTHDTNPHLVPIQVPGLPTPITAIAAGYSHNMALDSSGAVWLWGSNGNGQLGNGNYTEQDAPSKITNFIGTIFVAASIAAGGGSSMAQKPDGTVWVWGGDNNMNTPTPAPALPGVTAMYINEAGTFIITSGGTLWSIFPSGGQLQVGQMPTPNNATVTSVSSSEFGSNITVALTDTTVWSVGDNISGQLGDGTTTSASHWNWIQAKGISNVVQVQVGESHTVALTTDGTVWSWGGNGSGQLAAVSTLEQDVPVPNRLVLGRLTSAAIGAVTDGAFFLVVKKNGDVLTWGSNSNGQLGDGGTTDSYTTPVHISNLGNVAQVAASGNASSYAIKKDGTLWAWGYNGYGQLGLGDMQDRHLAAQVVGLTGIVTAIAPGTLHTIALKNDGTVWAWGFNFFGQLGDGSTTQRLLPVQVTGLTGVIAIAIGAFFSLALENDGTVWAWGIGSCTGTTSQQNTPIQVSGLSNIVAIDAAGDHALALKNDGTVWAWGDNSEGEQGNGTTSVSAPPQQVPGLANVKAICAGSAQNFVIKQDGTTWGWGYNGSGQLGNGTIPFFGNQFTPVQVLLPGITRILCNGNVTLALVKDPDPDFNADNMTDLLWQNIQTGQHSVWYMNNTTWPGSSGSSDFLGSAIPTIWTLAGTADFDGNGQADLLWQNTQTGDVTIWYMNGATYTGNASYVAQGIPLQWKIVGTADMDGDGTPDLIWQNASAGDVVVWYMKGGTWTNNWDYLARGIPASWHVASIQDLVGNNQPQLLWQSEAGQVVWWDMDWVTGWTGNWSYIYQNLPAPWVLTRAH